MIQTLPPLTPNAQRGQRTIARCHQRLARRRKRLGRAAGGENTFGCAGRPVKTQYLIE